MWELLLLESTCMILNAPLVPLDFPSSFPQLSFSPSYFYLYRWAVTGSVCPPASQLCKVMAFALENLFSAQGPDNLEDISIHLQGCVLSTRLL